ncbi:MAG: SLC13 family permease [Planctomycetota bacterium]|nr:MAG: SLC13 family permease [Planctomycetota bacterium]
MEPAAVIALVVVVLVLLTLALTRLAADAVLVAGLTLLMVAPVPAGGGWRLGVIGPGPAISGFANTGLATVAVLYVVVTGLRETGAIDWIASVFLGRPRGLRRAMLRLMAPVWGMSAFLNNTPVVAMLIPAVQDWSARLRLPASKLLIPLSYAAILGGTCTLIGTSTNLVVNGLMIDAGLPSMTMFEIAKIGVPSAVVGMAFLLLVGPRLLPDRGSSVSVFADPREYTLELVVPVGSPLAGRTVEQAGLRNLPGCYLVNVERDGEPLGAVGPEQVLRVGDRLLFAGVVEAVRDVQNLRGLAPATDQVFKLDSPRYRRRLFEAVIAESCGLCGMTIREGRFRNRYQAVVLAVARNGARVAGRIGDIILRPGDTLLIEADADFADRHRNSRDFLLVSPLEDSTPRRHARAPVAVAILALMVALATAGVLSMLVAAMVASGLMIVTRCCTISEARRSVDWSVLVVIGAALGIGHAMEQTGAAEAVANAAFGLGGDHPWVALGVVYAVTSILTASITNNAAVALMFPIVLGLAQRLGVSPVPFLIALMMAGSASFATPIGYQTNLMVYGPGGYRFSDFLRIGVPLNLLLAVVAVGLIPLIWGF